MNLTREILKTRAALNAAQGLADEAVVAQLSTKLDGLEESQRNRIAHAQQDPEQHSANAYHPETGALTHFGTTIHGLACWVKIDKDHGAGTYDVTVMRGPGKLAGRSFRISGCFPEF